MHVRFCSHIRLKSDSMGLPKCANTSVLALIAYDDFAGVKDASYRGSRPLAVTRETVRRSAPDGQDAAASLHHPWFILDLLSPVGLRQGNGLRSRDVRIDKGRAAETVVGRGKH
jgi:hypothetical protein